MKNLKKVLALVLVVASLMGMATMVSATKSDDYSDADSITHVEAVDVMSTIGVFDGISGAFSGDSILTREQAAKIITYMILGKDDADALVASVAPYTDVSRDRWSAGSIAYCKNAGILAGVGNGRFEPDGKLTGVAFAKMCLVALGYDPEIEKLTGSQWAVNTSTIAIAGAGITGNLSQVSLADEMSREDACQMAFNTLQADMVDYDNRGSVIIAGDVTVNTNPSKAKPVSVETGWQDVEGKKNDGKIEKDGIQQFAEKYFTNLKKFPVTDSFGRPSTEWSYKANKIGTYVKNSQLVQTWTAKASKGEMYNAVGSAIAGNIYELGTDVIVFSNDYDGKYGMMVSVDGVRQEINDEGSDYFKKNSNAAAGKELTQDLKVGQTGNGVLTELYMDDNGNVTIAMINTYLVQANSDYNTVNERVSIEAVQLNDNLDPSKFLPTYIEQDDFDVSGVKDGDYLLLTVSFDGAWGQKVGSGNGCNIESVTPATVQTGTVTEYTNTSDVTVGGTKYSYNKLLGGETVDESFTINSDATLILDTYGYIMCVDEAFTSNSFVYIADFDEANGSFGNDPIADAYFTDGTHKTIHLSKVHVYKNSTDDKTTSYGKSEIYENAQDTKPIKVGWYTFTGTGNDLHTLTAPSKSRYDATVTRTFNASSLTGANKTTIIKNGSVKFMSDTDSSIKANEKTIFVVKDNKGDVRTYTGIANAPDVTLTGDDKKTESVKISYLKKTTEDYARFVFVNAYKSGAKVNDVGGTVDYMFVLKETSNMTHVDGLTYYKYKVVIDGKEEERWIADDGDKVEAGRLYKSVKEDSNGRISGATEVDSSSARQWSSNITSGAVSSNGNALNIVYNVASDSTPLSIDLLVNSKSNVNLVLAKGNGKNAAHQEYADGDDYVRYQNVSASFVSGILNDYTALSGTIYLIRADDDSEVIDTLWIYVDSSVVKNSST